MNRKIVFFISAVIFFVIFGKYITHVCPSVLGYLDDSPSLVVAAATYGIPHGFYPLFIMMGFVFSKIPLGEVAFRLNFANSIFAIFLSILLFYTLVYLFNSWKSRNVSVKLIAAVVTTLIFASFREIRWQAEDFEVHIFHAFFTGLFIACLIFFGKSRSKKAFYFLSLSLGFLLAISPTSFVISILPFVVYLLFLFRRSNLSLKNYIVGFFLFCFPLLSFIPYIYQIKHASFNYVETLAPVMTPWFWKAHDFSSALWRAVWHFGGWERLSLFKESLSSMYDKLYQFFLRPFFLQMGYLGVILLLAGFFESLVKNKKLTLTLLLALVFWLFNIFSLRVDFMQDKVLPIWFIVYIWLGVGLLRWFSIFWGKKFLRGEKLARLPFFIISVFPIFLIFSSVYKKSPRPVNMDCFTSRARVYQEIQSIPPNAVLATAWGSPINYYLIVENVRPDIKVFPGYAHSPTRKKELKVKYRDRLIIEDTWQMARW